MGSGDKRYIKTKIEENSLRGKCAWVEQEYQCQNNSRLGPRSPVYVTICLMDLEDEVLAQLLLDTH